KVFFSVNTFEQHNKKDEEFKQLFKFVKENNLEKAKMTFENLKNKLNEEELVKAINFLMECVVSQNPENGQKFIEEEMLKNNISPNEFTLSIWMKAYCNKGKPEKAEKILRNASKYNINH